MSKAKHYKRCRKLPPAPCFACGADGVKQGYCAACGHLSKFAHMETYRPEQVPKEKPAVAIDGGAIWELPVRAEDEEEID